ACYSYCFQWSLFTFDYWHKSINESLISSSIFVFGSGALIIEIPVQDMIENVLEIKDTHVREVMNTSC
ncbi:hypothetical protein J1N35_008998, partial [Gossypium stocksii]